MVDQVLANMTRVDNSVNAVLLQLASGTHTTQHEELGGFEDSLGEDNLAAGEEAQLIARSINDRHTLTGTVRVVDDEALGVHLGDNGDVGLVLHKQETARTHTLVDAVTAVGETVHLTIIDVLGDRLASSSPGLGDSIAERLHLVQELSVRDVDGSTRANLLQVLVIQTLVVMVGGTFAEVGHQGVPGPFLAPKFLPPVECGLAARHPGEVVQRRATTKGLATSVGLLDPFVVVPFDHRGLVRPVVLTVSQLHGLRRRGDHLDLLRVADTCLNDKYSHVGVFGQTTGDGVTGGTTANNDEVIVGTVLGHDDNRKEDACLRTKGK